MDVFEVKAEVTEEEDGVVVHIRDGHSHANGNGDQAGDRFSHQMEEEGFEMIAEEEEERSPDGGRKKAKNINLAFTHVYITRSSLLDMPIEYIQ